MQVLDRFNSVPAECLADPIVADLVYEAGLVVEADVLAKLAVADLPSDML